PVMTSTLPILALALTLLPASSPVAAPADDGSTPAVALGPFALAPESRRAPPPVDLALCLDTSGSMDGLIDAAKSRLWALVNDLATAEPLPDLRVALLTYGNDGHDAENGWVRVDVELTRDLDLVSQQLFALTTNGGTEFVGRVVHRATEQLLWSDDPSALRLLVVAGNEGADQDTLVTAEDAARAAIARGIQVDAIYCGSPSDVEAPGWNEVARLADGTFACIDQDDRRPLIATPFDDELAELSRQLNATYVPWGGAGADGMSNQAAQDANASTMGPAAAAERASTKAGALYRCAWDLLDALDAGSVALDALDPAELPQEFAGLDADDLAARIETLRDERGELQRTIGEVSRRREAFLADERSKRAGEDGDAGFDAALRDALRAQAAAKGLRFAEPASVDAPETAGQTDAARESCAAPDATQTASDSP
ncbi:MAG: VWA domain-containing protein, partial [Planctomycetes bacterium]|nr:VWA domain-containing protein [Planctomycetota bacterium]